MLIKSEVFSLEFLNQHQFSPGFCEVMKKYRTHNSWYVRSLKNNSFSQTVAGGHDQFQLFGQRLREGFPLALGAPNPWDNTSEAQLTWWFSKGIPPKMAFQIKDLYVESPGWNLNKFDLPFQERDQDQIHITHHTSHITLSREWWIGCLGVTFFVSPTLCQAKFSTTGPYP